MGICARFRLRRLACTLLILCVFYGLMQVAQHSRAQAFTSFFPRGLNMQELRNALAYQMEGQASRSNGNIKGLPPSTAPVKTAMLKYTIPSDFDATYIGDTYLQEDEPYRINDCPTAIRKRIMSTDFRHIYLGKIPILVWKNHAIAEEYERLRIYNGCFGWNHTSWDILNQTLALLNTSANGYIFSDWNRKATAASPCIRCAAVGNGGILNGSKMGKEIDQHDYVFRVNGAILDGFEEDVGNRTSFYFSSTNTMMNSLGAYGRHGFRHVPQTKETSYVFVSDHDRDYLLVRAAITHQAVDQGKDKGRWPSKYFGENYTREQFKILHPDFMRYLRNRFLLGNSLRTKHRDIYRPSTGASMLLTAIHACDEVDAYGFLTPDYKNYSDHYYDKIKTRVMFYANHDYNREMKLWQKLNMQGIIRLYQGPRAD
ncbi:alpha-N-acetylgalactosaminide alpha-2,6-sialyltransferase 2-like isoform X2 [Ambystoma mexicanum]|uniref:alpha-N-acetylgalactosaminide alpha-2,6-sialyltransferase 2-like isoform X2 n=1 Tax=Ambystoma mexicanum TaxID=8296 RepID=UPI0037E92D78